MKYLLWVKLSLLLPSLSQGFVIVGMGVLQEQKVSIRTLQNRRCRQFTRIFGGPFDDDAYYTYRPIPTMPSPLFVNLAQSQMELLAFSVVRIKAMSLYLPQEHTETGQLEFLPAILYPHSERVFIANDANSGEAPHLPRTLTRLPGFEHATSLLPGYPMVSSDSPGVGTVEEVMCDPVTKTSALSVPLFQGRQTVGVLLVWSHPPDAVTGSHWTQVEKEQISRAAQSLSLALSMDAERKILQKQSEKLKTQLSDALHQVKNPIQALRTYGKLLQRKLADSDFQELNGGSPQLLELTRHLVAQSDRVVDLMSPFDTIVKSLPSSKQPLALNPYRPPTIRSALTPWRNATPSTDYWRDVEEPMIANNQTIEFSRGIREYSFTNGAIDFTRDSTLVDATEVSESSIVASDEILEMGFVMDILDPILSAGKVLASEKGVDLQIIASSDLPGVWVSPTALQEAVSNVMDNAIKYVTLGQSSYPRVVVEIEQHPTVPGVVIRVSDNGPGIPLEEQNDIFKRGHRGERTLDIEGSGIGLDISRSMMTRMGGELRLAGSSDNGSTFEFILYRGPKLKL